MALATLADLRQAVFDEVLRASTLTGAFPRLVAFAEHRMWYGAGAPQPSPALRLGVMEKSVNLVITAGVASVPQDFLEARVMTWDAQPSSQPNYEPPTIFRRYQSNMTTGFPLKYTITSGADGKPQMLFSPLISSAGDGSDTNMIFNYYAKPMALVQDTDTNPVLLAYPSVYFNAVLGEAYKYLRDSDRRDEAYAVYTGLVNGLASSDAKAATGGTPLYPRIRNSRVW